MKRSLINKRIVIIAMGCRTNQSEADALASMLEAFGAHIVSSPPYDGAILVSCTVTSMADKKSRQFARRLRRESKDAVIVACGCWAQKVPSQIAQGLGVDILVGTRQKASIPTLMEEAFEKKNNIFTDLRSDVLYDSSWDPLFQRHPLLHTRAFVKVQDGCNHFCSYCIIPFVRGKPVSRPWQDVLNEVHSIVDSGCSEVVLTGVHLGLYGTYGEISLGELVRRIGSVPGVRRIRFGSLEPFGIDDTLLSALAETPQFCPHLHLPLQSGDDDVLERMGRGYTVSDFMASVKRIRSFLGERVHISTDILVGFPGESDRAFRNTLRIMDEIGLGKVHVFPYSIRQGTRAASFKEQIPREIAQERVHQTITKGEELLKSYCSQWLGKDIPILVEEVSDGRSTGLTPFFVKVETAQKFSIGDIVTVRPFSYASESLRA
ncbi:MULTISPECIES: tRNA (N(6)-L-threonylcarbamoyladenosine(37)-C(2))-methylthiotransferase MtaB [Aminobacterium]|uniref:tRNA (N(6)-L-threonylcarbamoyladenosine(37)-C(2))- methylthiotransferase MtaB n=1 Tax=Aminobacterium TaxID=81466 RepID=UPI00257C520E|nr:tRNA (N(6)-L-threonylcarbamoyladenosine(37)-C(2))-methylthiotransferase MtaB [Aminobacterium sp. UBA4834]